VTSVTPAERVDQNSLPYKSCNPNLDGTKWKLADRYTSGVPEEEDTAAN
jgi:hypothetical protein